MAKKTQNYKNHVRLVPGFHFVSYGLLLMIFAVGCYMIFNQEAVFAGSVVLLIAVNLSLITIFTRMFALKAQDRAIRAEENLRYFILTGKPLSKNLRLSQIIALRFASDEEFVALAELAENESLKSKEIKMSIKNWRGDYHRV